MHSIEPPSGNNRTAPAELPLIGEEWKTPGYLMVIGGSDRLDPEATLQRLFLKFVERAEHHSGQHDIVLVTSATRHPEILADDYIRIMTRLGVQRSRIHAPFIRNREEASHPQIVDLLTNAAGIFVTGGDQYALTQTIDRTPAEHAMRDAYGRGAVIAGTSAGATAMGRPMIVAGGGSGELRLGMVQMSRGLAWVGDDVIIDTHFGARGRFPRLAAAVAEYPAALGVGIDENTCLLVDASGQCTVAGKGVVYVVDAAHTQVNSAPSSHSGHPITVAPLQVSVLSAGGKYDLRARRLLLEMHGAGRV